MIKKMIFFSVIVVSSVFVNAQSDTLVEDGLFKVNALLPGVSYEVGIGNESTLNLDAIVGIGFVGGTGRNSEFGIYPGVAAAYRRYMNFSRRLSKGKNISGNSGNYISFLNQFQFGKPIIGNLEHASDYYYNVAAVYGIQRTRPKGFYWGMAFGPGVFVNEFDATPGILIDVRLGWVIGGRKK